MAILFLTKEEYDDYLKNNIDIQVWSARNNRWKDINKNVYGYHPYNRYRIKPVTNDQSVVYSFKDKVLKTKINTDISESKLKKSAKKFAGLIGHKGIWFNTGNGMIFKPVGMKGECLEIILKMI